MDTNNYEGFKEAYLEPFRRYYSQCTNNKQRKKIKKSLFNTNKLSKQEKKEFWEEVLKRDV